MKRKRKIYGVVAAAVADGDISLNNALTHICNESPNTVVPRLPVRVNDAVNNIQNTGQEVMIQEHENDISDIDVDINDCDEASISPVLRTISEREFFMAMVGKYLFLKYSNNRIKKEISIDNLLERPTITFNEYNKYVNDINSRYRVRKFYMCPSCWRLLPKVKNCICGMRFKRGKESTPILIQTKSLLLLFQGFAPPHVINDIYQRIYTIDNKVDSMMNKFQADCSALQASFTRLDTLVTQMKSQIDILSGIYSNQNGDELVADKYVFDPINITVERSEFDAVAKFYNGSNETINIYDCAALTKYFHRTNHEDLPRDLYTSILTEIYGEDNIHHYSAAKNSEFTSCFNLLDPITNFIAKGYCTATLTDIEVQFIRSWIKKSISSVNTWFFTNSRRNKKKAEEKEAQVEHRTPVRKRGREEINRTSSKKRRDDRIPRRHRIISIESD